MDLDTRIGESLSTDYFLLREEFTPAQLEYLQRTRTFVEQDVLPEINGYWERAEFPWPLIEKMAAAGIVGDGIVGYGCPEIDPMSAGLITMELSRGDGSLATFLGVQAGLAMRSIAMLGSEEQKQRWLPPMARLEKLGAFALTEPDHGSDSIALESTARRDGDSYVLDGHKKWIGNGSIADVVVVWARDTADGQVKGFLVEKDTPGYRARVIEGKGSLRAVWQAEIELDELRVPAENKLPGAESFRNTAAVLASTRVSCAWAALGHAVAGYDAALTYAQRRAAVRQAAGQLPARAEPAGEDAGQGHRDAAVLPAAGRPGTGRRRRPDAGRAGQGAQHQHGPRGARRGPGPAGRQRHPARLPRDPAHDRHRVHPHLRGHRVHADADRRPGHHRRLRLRLTPHPHPTPNPQPQPHPALRSQSALFPAPGACCEMGAEAVAA